MSKVVVLGGGISGLCAAYFLTLKNARVTVVQGKQRGGWIQTLYRGTEYIETGPRSLRPVGDAAFVTLDMIYDLGLEKDILGIPSSSPAAQNRYIYFKGQLNNLSSNPFKIFASNAPILQGFVPALLKESFQPKSKEVDESIHSFVSRRLGPYIAENMISAVIHGIYAGDTKMLSIRSTMKSLHNFEKNHGSITNGILASLFKKVEPYQSSKPEAQKFIEKVKQFKIYSFTKGMQTLTDALEGRLKARGVEIIPESAVAVRFNPETVEIETETMEIVADKVISAIPSKKLSKLLSDADLKEKLDSIESVTVGVVNLVYKGDVVKSKGFGFLVPQSESDNLDIIGVVYDSCSFPEHSTGSGTHTRMTVMMGGHAFESKFKNPDTVSKNHLLDVSLESVEKVLGIRRDLLVDSYVSIQKDCIPQYYVGHEEKVQSIYEQLDKLSNGRFIVTGASYNGVSVNDCVYNSREAATKVLSQ
ncbi:hypothetical protein HDV01_001819 [Terramyces sp. JEL0728]|nr:hypothetical protein HDV01_001819 [Terramyces sp. JEL0728]